MLQQTRVETVIPYYQRFMIRFPQLRALADAPLDAVLEHWAGLGYYARARNLHGAARRIVRDHGGRFPRDFDAIVALPGIGPSTAGAILAQCWNRRHAIVDGNVRRVLCRHFGVRGWPGEPSVDKLLWAIAEYLTPRARVAAYTQAIMDLGATVCRRSRPHCDRCPHARFCTARKTGATQFLPAPRPRRTLPERHVMVLLIRDQHGKILLERRPPTGLWGGLWSLPECPPESDPVHYARRRLGMRIRLDMPWPACNHVLSHFRLILAPHPARILGCADAVQDDAATEWVDPAAPGRGLAAPIARLLQRARREVRDPG